jgi:cell pole-organizing protein PopZ
VSPAAAVDSAAAVVVPVAAPAEVAPTAEVPVAAAAAEPAPGPKDPLWFLSQPPASPTPEPKPVHPPEQPKPARLGAVRGPLPPFFGSSAEEVMKVEMVPDRAVRSRTDAMPPPPAAPPLSAHLDPPPLPPSAPAGLHAVNGDAVRVADSARTSAIFDSPAADSAAGGGGEAQPPQIQVLEAMVADLLRPMLRRWLDENMPRLVSAALKAEAELMSRRGSGRDPKKS